MKIRAPKYTPSFAELRFPDLLPLAGLDLEAFEDPGEVEPLTDEAALREAQAIERDLDERS